MNAQKTNPVTQFLDSINYESPKTIGTSIRDMDAEVVNNLFAAMAPEFPQRVLASDLHGLIGDGFTTPDGGKVTARSPNFSQAARVEIERMFSEGWTRSGHKPKITIEKSGASGKKAKHYTQQEVARAIRDHTKSKTKLAVADALISMSDELYLQALSMLEVPQEDEEIAAMLATIKEGIKWLNDAAVEAERAKEAKAKAALKASLAPKA